MCSEVYEGIEQGLVGFVFKFHSFGWSFKGLVCMVEKQMCRLTQMSNTILSNGEESSRAVRGLRDCQGETSAEGMQESK